MLYYVAVQSCFLIVVVCSGIALIRWLIVKDLDAYRANKDHGFVRNTQCNPAYPADREDRLDIVALGSIVSWMFADFVENTSTVYSNTMRLLSTKKTQVRQQSFRDVRILFRNSTEYPIVKKGLILLTTMKTAVLSTVGPLGDKHITGRPSVGFSSAGRLSLACHIHGTPERQIVLSRATANPREA